MDPIATDLLLSRCDFLVESQLWPIETKLDYKGWLTNFNQDEMRFAASLLNAFTYFSQNVTIELFKFAFRQLAACVVDHSKGIMKATEDWKAFTDNVLVTLVRGEDPSTTDSGYLFARYARQNLGINPTQIVSNEAAIEMLYFDAPRPLLLVDDFAGSGSQFCETWTTPHTIAESVHRSFQDVMRIAPYPAYYCPVIAAWKAIDKIAQCDASIDVRPAHLIDRTYSLLGADSQCWSDELKPEAERFLHDASKRAGYATGWRGFHDLGLAIAFEHGIPDATLPIFFSERLGWKPLVKRS